MPTRTNHLLTALFLFMIPLAILIQGCSKEAGRGGPSSSMKKPSNNTTAQPQPFYFSNCNDPAISGNFISGVPASATITLNYVNSPGGSHTGYSATYNGITLSAPAGNLDAGSGSIVITASGTPVSAGITTFGVSIGSSYVCHLNLTVLNPPASGPTVDPGPGVGSTGVVNFTYKGQPVAYTTVRAADGKIWLQQNLGSSQVAIHHVDQASFGDYFQWGRWDDGHQSYNSPVMAGGPSISNPSGISPGNPNFITGSSPDTKWWGTGGVETDTWSGVIATSTNGRDPCAALGQGWRLPTAAEWNNIALLEDLFGTIAAFQSNLKLPTAGYRSANNFFTFQNGDIGYYWSGNAAGNSHAVVFSYDDVYNAGTVTAQRAEGFSCRCIKD